MKNKRKKLLSLLLAVSTLLTLFPFLPTYATEIVERGECGEGVNYTLDSDGLLIISGNGSIANTGQFRENTSIQTVVIEEGITAIPDYTFLDCINLRSVSIPETVSHIGVRVLVNTAIFGSKDYYTNGDALYINNWLIAVNPQYIGENLGVFEIQSGTKGIAPGVFGETVYDEFINLVCIIPKSVEIISEGAFPQADYPFGVYYYGTANDWASIQIGEHHNEALLNTVHYNYNGDVLPLSYGKCGDSVNWSIYSDGLLKIEGSGAMYDYQCSEHPGMVSWDAPWKEFLNLYANWLDYSPLWSILRFIKAVELSEGITRVGDSSFSELFDIESILLPSTITSIGKNAFSNCVSLQMAELPNSVTEIGENTFSGCVSLRNMILSNQLRVIPKGTFSDCVYLNQIEIPSSVQKIVSDAFQSCISLENLTILNDEVEIIEEEESLAPSSMYVPSKQYGEYSNLILAYIRIMSLVDRHCIDQSFFDNDFAIINEMLGTAYGSPEDIEEDSEGVMQKLSDVLPPEIYEAILGEEGSDNGSFTPLLTIYGHKGSTSETYATRIRAPFVCLHVYVDGICKYCGDVDASQPDWGDWTDDENGLTHSRVDNSNPTSVQTEAHIWDDGSVVIAATCGEQGVALYSCTVCGATTTEPIPMNGHTLVRTAASTPDCFIDGNEEYYTCSKCGKYYADEDGTTEIEMNSWILPAAHGLDVGFDEEEVASTCSVKGYCRVICLDCGEIVENTIFELSPDNHKGATVVRNARGATCTLDGYTGDTYCVDCGVKIADGEAIVASGHAWNDGEITTPATCSVPGIKTYTCNVCFATREEETEIEENNHVNTTEIGETSSTCNVHGYTSGVYCLDCKQFVSGHKEKPLSDHMWNDGIVTTAATCITKGVETLTCAICSKTIEVESEIDPNNHIGDTFVVGATQATCSTHGYTGDTYCSDCRNIILTGVQTPFADHELAKTAARSATCTEEGNSAYFTCSSCGKYFADSNAETEIEVNSWILSALDHDWSAWLVTSEATYLHSGEKVRRCMRCTAVETSLIEKLIPDAIKTDENTGSQLAFQDNVVPTDTKLVVDEEFDGVYFELLNREKGNVRKQLFNITLESDGEKIQPTGYVLVRLPIPEGYNIAYLNVYYIASDGSGMKKMDSYIDGEYICFETTHFSEYAIVDETPSQAEPEKPQSNCACGKYHSGAFSGLIRFFHSIIYFFKNLFK